MSRYEFLSYRVPPKVLNSAKSTIQKEINEKRKAQTPLPKFSLT